MNEVEEFLQHYGVRGMKWGVRRSKRPSGPGSDDFERTKEIRKKSKLAGARSLSNSELKTAIERMNLEQQYSRLTTQKSVLGIGIAKVRDLLNTGKTVTDAAKFVNSVQDLTRGKIPKKPFKNLPTGSFT